MGKIYDPRKFVDRGLDIDQFHTLLDQEQFEKILLVQGDGFRGKSRLVGRLEAECSKSGEQPGATAVAFAKVDFQSPLGQHKLQKPVDVMKEIRKGLRLGSPGDEFDRLLTLFESSGAQPGAGVPPDLETLAEKMTDRGTSEDVDRVRGLLGMPTSAVAPGTPRYVAYQVVQYAWQRGKLGELFDAHLSTVDGELEGQYWSPEKENLLRGAPGAGAQLGLAGLQVDRGLGKAEEQLTEAFFEWLQNLECKPLVVLFDGYESAPKEIVPWIEVELLGRIATELKGVVVVLSGQRVPDLSALRIENLALKSPLQPLGPPDVVDLFSRLGVPIELQEAEILCRGDKAQPGLLALWAEYKPKTG